MPSARRCDRSLTSQPANRNQTKVPGSKGGSFSANYAVEHAAGGRAGAGGDGGLANFPPPGALARAVADRAAEIDHAAVVERRPAADAGGQSKAAAAADGVVDAAGGESRDRANGVR